MGGAAPSFQLSFLCHGSRNSLWYEEMLRMLIDEMQAKAQVQTSVQGLVAQGASWALGIRNMRCHIGLPPRRPQLHTECSTKDLLECSRMILGVKPDCRSILPGQIYLAPATLPRVEEEKLQPNDHSLNSLTCLSV
jgi:hypothetical protein